MAGVLVVGNPLGLGVLLTALAVVAAVELQRPRPTDGWSFLQSGLAIALTATAVVSSARWTLAIALPAAAGVAALSVAQGRSWQGLLRGTWTPLVTSWSATVTLTRAVADRAGGRVVPVAGPALRGIGLALALTTVFGGLFVSADAAFADLFERYLVPDWDLTLLPFRVVVALLIAVGVTALALAAASSGDEPTREVKRRLGRVEWVTALTALDLLFVSFVAVQLTVLFGGHLHVLDTAGLTYAEYAREGFFQLLLAAGLTFGVIAGAFRWSRTDSSLDHVVLRLLLGLLCVLTMVVLASALRRLWLYEQAFGFTRARMLAHAILLWFGALFALVLLAGMRRDAPWLPRTALAVTGAVIVAFVLVRPDSLVAQHNVRRFAATNRIDLAYLDGLSADAVPALVDLPDDLHRRVIADDLARLARPDPWHAFNLSRARARRILVDLGLLSPREQCPAHPRDVCL
ncbi:MAG: DUF4173 domain-containing protein [Actinomycetota bacterium]|nr:DUF4173 domain-containing protein [Actinomycetota bacterium]